MNSVLIDRVEGNICLVLVDVKYFEEKNCRQMCRYTIKEVGKQVFCIHFYKTIRWSDILVCQIWARMSLEEFTIYYDCAINDRNRSHYLMIEKINSGANTEALIAMINQDKFIETKQHLVNVFPLVKVAVSRLVSYFLYCSPYL